VIATGGRPAVPSIPGLDATPYLTNETLFALEALPQRLIVLGGGPIGIEMAQAFRRLGAAVTVVEAAQILSREDPEAAEVVRAALRGDGVDLREGAAVTRADSTPEGVALTLEGGETVTGSHLLVATGRRPALDRLDLTAAGIETNARGIVVDAGLRSVSNRRVYAVGDVAGGAQFTHVAGYHAGIVIRSALFRLPARARIDHIPRVTYTDPELAQIGPTEAEARAADPRVSTVRTSFAENDRARAERRTEGFVKAVLDRRGRVIGATVVGAGAGEQIGVWALAVSERLKIGAVAGIVAPYPTRGEAAKRAAGAHFTLRLFENPMLKRIVRLLARLG
jgi:pyruvate/2-oxoglutarate dehydrogenase complex dihydrolipoamide dehydrogenase (E3) component